MDTPMTRTGRWLGVLALGLSLACARDPAPPAEPEPKPTEPTAEPDTPAETAQTSSSGRDWYADDGELVGQYTNLERIRERIPDETSDLYSQIILVERERIPILYATFDGEVLYVIRLSCSLCEPEVGDGLWADLSRMSPDQIKAVQAELGLEDDVPVLDTADKWREFVSYNNGL